MTKSKPKRSRLEKLRHSWERASDEERRAFLEWTGSCPVTAAVPISTGRYLTPLATRNVLSTLRERGLTLSELAAELDCGTDARALARAMAGQYGLRLAVIAALEKWLGGIQPA